MTETVVLVQGLRTRVRIHGEGPPLLLIGGVWGQVELWDTLLPHLDGFQVIMYDPPGIGQTDLSFLPYTPRCQASFAADLLTALGVERAHVLGVSLGGAVAQEVARDHPGRVDRLVLVSTAFGAPGLPGRPEALLRFARPTIYYGRRDALERNAGVMLGGRLRTEPELVHQWHIRPPRSRKAYLWRLLGTVGWSSLPWAHRLSRPTLVMHGDDDPIVPLFNGRVLAQRIPDSRLHVVRGGGHLMLLDSAAGVAPVIARFLNES